MKETKVVTIGFEGTDQEIDGLREAVLAEVVPELRFSVGNSRGEVPRHVSFVCTEEQARHIRVLAHKHGLGLGSLAQQLQALRAKAEVESDQ
jgi:hypothetical protein